MAPAAAAIMLQKGELHAYIGADPFAARREPADVRAVESFGGYVVITFNPTAPAASSRESRCDAARRIAGALGSTQGLYRAHPYPVTPYDSDYLAHFDLLESRKKEYQPGTARGSVAGLRVRARGPLAEKLLGGRVTATGSWDATVEEVDLEDLIAPQRIGVDGWLGPPWLKAGWFHAYLLHAPAVTDRATRQTVDGLYQRLVSGTLADPSEELNAERSLVTHLVAGCERVVVGYRLQRERFNAEFSQGVENIAYDSQSGFNSAIFLRTVKLKDFPWNGWLRIGLATKATAAWNPIGGFSDPAGRLAWAALGDPALIPSPYGGSWVDDRVVTAAVTMDPRSPVSIPEDALAPEAGTGAFHEVGKGKTARAKITYRIRASAFHDNTRMTAADAVYAYSFAFRWGAKRAQAGNEYDSAVEAKTAVLRKSLAAFKVLRVDTEVKKFSDVAFTYIIPVVEVYLDASVADPQTLASFAPPWSPVPWQVMVLMEEAVKRGFGAFSAEEAKRRSVHWLDLVRDPKLQEALTPLLDRFAKEAHVPEPLRRFVTADDAQTRWTALKQFAQRRGHFLVTNGPYRLEKWTDSGITLEVFRDFSNPMGVGSFDRFAIPRRAYVSKIVPRGARLEVYPEIERVEKFLRDYRIVREPLGRPGSDEGQADVPVCRYVVVSADGTVAAAGSSRETSGNRLVVNLKDRLKPGAYTVLVALALGDNDVDPEISTIAYRVEGAS